MPGFFRRLFGLARIGAGGGARGGRRYEKERELAASSDAAVRLKLAQKPDVHPEILYYLASDRDEAVRKAVAQNLTTPVKASDLLARDGSADVRLALAAKLVQLLPELSADQHSQLYAFTVGALRELAQDSVVKVRKALATALKDHALAPPKVVEELARDVEREVAEPILRECVALADGVLLDILGNHPESWVVQAIAGRPAVSAPVAKGVFETGDVEGSRVLLLNSHAAIPEETLQQIVDTARDHPEWHGALAGRKGLTLSMARKMTGYVGAAVLAALQARNDFDRETQVEIAAIVRRRLDFVEDGAAGEIAVQRVQRLAGQNRLERVMILDALAWDDREFVMAALAWFAEAHPLVIEKIFQARAPKAVVALCWRAGLTARDAVTLQKDMARLHHAEILYAKNGEDFPLTRDDMVWQLEFFGLTPRARAS